MVVIYSGIEVMVFPVLCHKAQLLFLVYGEKKSDIDIKNIVLFMSPQ